MSSTDVLIVGAGPTGLVLAIWLTKLGIPVRIVDAAPRPATSTRAVAVQARTLELYAPVVPELAAAIASRARKIAGPNIWVNGRRRGARLRLADASADQTAYPYVYLFPQDEHERLLAEHLARLGVFVERGTSLVTFTQDDDDDEDEDGAGAGAVRAVLRTADGSTQECEARYIAGCDGAHSAVRRGMGVGFPGGTYEQVFYVADLEATGPAMDGELHLCVDTSDFLGVFPLPSDSPPSSSSSPNDSSGRSRARLIGIVGPPPDPSDAASSGVPPDLTFDDVRGRAVDEMQLRDIRVRWFATYRAHHRVAERFRLGRAFLAGDAAHIHSPAGGQGMNTGIGDAANLAWKLAAVLDGSSSARDARMLLDTYEEERARFARALVRTTDRAFSFMTRKGRVAGLLRSVFVRIVAPVVFSFRAVRRRGFRALSQLMLNYTGTALAGDDDGAAGWFFGMSGGGGVVGGERLPWVEMDGQHNYASLEAIKWQIHVYGSASEDLAAWCEANGLRLTVFGWAAAYGSAGLVKDAIYLLRPDTYIALVDKSASTTTIEEYFAKRHITLKQA